MKKILAITFIVAIYLLAPLSGDTSIKRTHRYGYSEHQWDYKKMRYHWSENNRRGGYYNHKYHNQGSHFRPNDEQFIPAGKKHKHKHKYRK